MPLLRSPVAAFGIAEEFICGHDEPHEAVRLEMPNYRPVSGRELDSLEFSAMSGAASGGVRLGPF
jgi:hypothetical protein